MQVGSLSGGMLAESCVCLQGCISGASFAHSLVSHTHMNDIDHYLTAIDSLPEALKSAKV